MKARTFLYHALQNLWLWWRMTCGMRNSHTLDTLIAELRVEIKLDRHEGKPSNPAKKALLDALLTHRQEEGRKRFPVGSRHTIEEDDYVFTFIIVEHVIERNGDLVIKGVEAKSMDTRLFRQRAIEIHCLEGG